MHDLYQHSKVIHRSPSPLMVTSHLVSPYLPGFPRPRAATVYVDSERQCANTDPRISHKRSSRLCAFVRVSSVSRHPGKTSHTRHTSAGPRHRKQKDLLLLAAPEVTVGPCALDSRSWRSNRRQQRVGPKTGSATRTGEEGSSCMFLKLTLVIYTTFLLFS